ncbi:hypothetical protein GJAV_G00081080 [Gymnothorax javanicus]|nr:hypothetical protein GJAV_G00081080 [Gymnothorax javanicus]
MFEAGTEAVSTTLRWGFVFMMKDPDIQKKVQDEIDSIIGQSRQPTLADRANMPYTNAVVHEIQRMGDVVPLGFPKMTSKDTMLGEHFIPKGTVVITSLSSVLKDKNEWETPNTFNPGHFFDSQGCFRRRNAFLPFSADEPLDLATVAFPGDEEETIDQEGTGGERGKEKDPGEGPSGAAAATQRPRRFRSVVRPEDHPILDIQQAGFRMLERELGGLQRGLCSINQAMKRSLAAMRRHERLLGQGVAALQRSAAALERLAHLGPQAPMAPVEQGAQVAQPPGTAAPSRSPPNTRASRQSPTSPRRPSRGQPSRRGPRLRVRGGKNMP